MLEAVERACERINRAGDTMHANCILHADSIHIRDSKLSDIWNRQATGGLGGGSKRNIWSQGSEERGRSRYRAPIEEDRRKAFHMPSLISIFQYGLQFFLQKFP